MTKALLVVVACALVLTACSAGRWGLEGTTAYLAVAVKKPDPNRPNVFVDGDKYLVIDQEPILIKIKKNAASDKYETVAVNFALDSSLTYVFDPADPADPLKISPLKGSQSLKVNCGFLDAKKVLACTYDPPDKGVYSYTLRVRNTATGDVITSDPSILND